MPRILRWTLWLSVIWSLLWGGAALVIRQAYLGWFADRESAGWTVEYADFSVSGYPFFHRVVIDAPVFSDPFNGTAWSGAGLQFESPAIWPGRQHLTVAPGKQRISYFDETATLTARDLEAILSLAPTRALQMQDLTLTSGPWRLRGSDGQVTEAAGLTLSMVQDPETPERYDITFDAPQFSPSSDLRDLSAQAASLPPAFDSLNLQATVTFDRPWDLRALDARRPQPRAIDLDLAEAKWGDLLLRMAGAVTVDETGQPDGQVTIQAENWKDALKMGREAELLPSEVFDAAEQGLSLLATMTGRPESLDVRINLRDGSMAVGILPIGPAPRLVLR